MNKPFFSLALYLTTCLVTTSLAAQTYTVPDNTPAHIRRAVESADRAEEQRVRDSGRKPAEVLTLADLNEGDHVAEISTFGQYYTPMLVEAVGPAGKVEMYDMPYLAAFQDGAVGRTGQAFADARPNAEYHIVDYSDIAFPANLDAVYNVLYYHDLQALEVDTAEMNTKVFNALVPGGKYVIVDHLSAPGAGWSQSSTIHRIEKSVIVDEITAAGFDLIVDSDILANPEDDHTAMVFSPGMRGGTDRAVLIFQKPF
jgi:predicted methyltransferase